MLQFPPPIAERPDGFQCLIWHRQRWRHVAWSIQQQGWMFGYASAFAPGDLDAQRLFAPLPEGAPEFDFWTGEQSL